MFAECVPSRLSQPLLPAPAPPGRARSGSLHLDLDYLGLSAGWILGQGPHSVLPSAPLQKGILTGASDGVMCVYRELSPCGDRRVWRTGHAQFKRIRLMCVGALCHVAPQICGLPGFL